VTNACGYAKFKRNPGRAAADLRTSGEK